MKPLVLKEITIKKIDSKGNFEFERNHDIIYPYISTEEATELVAYITESIKEEILLTEDVKKKLGFKKINKYWILSINNLHISIYETYTKLNATRIKHLEFVNQVKELHLILTGKELKT